MVGSEKLNQRQVLQALDWPAGKHGILLATSRHLLIRKLAPSDTSHWWYVAFCPASQITLVKIKGRVILQVADLAVLPLGPGT